MKPFGLTGGMGCGKSMVAKLLAKFSDVAVFDSDEIAKEVIASPELQEEIGRVLGVRTFPGLFISCQLIASIIFSEPEKKKRFEALIHPLVREEINRRITALPKGIICVVESALIYEVGSVDRYSKIIVATCAPEEQLRRLREVRGMSEEDIRVRLTCQLPAEGKVARADIVIDTDCPLHELERRVECLHLTLKANKGVR